MSPTFADSPRRARWPSLAWQSAAVILIAAALTALVAQTAINLRVRGIASGFGYLTQPAGFTLPPGLIPFSLTDTYARALAIGVVNTIRMAALASIAATALGVIVGIGRLAANAVLAGAARAYVEAIRNVPLLLQILCWYAAIQELPDVRAPWHGLPGLSLSNRGLVVYGLSISPEFFALFVALSTYTAAFIAENVRGGILAVPRGQTEAAAALGLSRLATIRRVVLPQALPVIVPPTANQFMSLTKNSSLAVAIGYPDLMSVTNTTLNQTGQSIEAMAVAMTLYLIANVAIAALTRAAFPGRPRV